MENATEVSKEKTAGTLACLLKKGTLSREIIDLLKSKIAGGKLYGKFQFMDETFQLMLEDGMTCYMGKSCKNAISCELTIFTNMLELMHLWEGHRPTLNGKTIFYIEHSKHDKLNLSYAKLSIAPLRNVHLYEANFSGACLSQAFLSNANLKGADFSQADLSFATLDKANLYAAKLDRTDLRGAKLRDADLYGASIHNAIIDGADMRGANLRRADLDVIHMEASVWRKEDILKILSKIKDSVFTFIMLESEGRTEKVYREQLFSDLQSEK